MVLGFTKNTLIPLHRGIFFTLIVSLSILAGCGTNDARSTDNSDATPEREDEFILLGYRNSVLEMSSKLMGEAEVFKSSESPVFNQAFVADENVPVEIDIANAYGCIYPDGRRVAFYPLTNLRLPKLNEIVPFGFLHYFDDNSLNVFFEVTVILPEEPIMLADSPNAPPVSEYTVSFLGPNNKPFGIVRSRLLDKTELSEEEAFRKFDTSSRIALLVTNSFDENKFFILLLKLDELDNQLFQIYTRWY